MGISYNPLWEMLKEKGISKMEFAKNVEISNATLAKLGKNEPVTLTIIDKICTQYNCKIEDVVQHIPTMHLDDTSKIPLDIGTIISTNYPFHKEDSRHQCYFVIIEKEKHSFFQKTIIITAIQLLFYDVLLEKKGWVFLFLK